MYSKCQRLSKLSFNSFSGIEKWLDKKCTCQNCQEASLNLENRAANTTITRHSKFTHNNLLLTSKMILKIKLEIEKQKLLNLNDIQTSLI